MTTRSKNSKPPKRPPGTWFQVDNAIYEVYANAIKAQGIAVYGVLAKHADKNFMSFPSIETIANQAGCTAPIVRRAIKKLTALNLIHVESKFSSRGQLSNTYHLLVPFQNRQGDSSKNNRASPTNSDRRTRTSYPYQGEQEDNIGAIVTDSKNIEQAEIIRKANHINETLRVTRPVDRTLILQVATLWDAGEFSDNDIEQCLESIPAKANAGQRIQNRTAWFRTCLSKRPTVKPLETFLKETFIPPSLFSLWSSQNDIA